MPLSQKQLESTWLSPTAEKWIKVLEEQSELLCVCFFFGVCIRVVGNATLYHQLGHLFADTASQCALAEGIL